jgi:hypothetical protein
LLPRYLPEFPRKGTEPGYLPRLACFRFSTRSWYLRSSISRRLARTSDARVPFSVSIAALHAA